MEKLCNPVRLVILFTVDSIENVSDPDFKTYIHNPTNCKVDSIYIEALKVYFKKEIPHWTPTNRNDTINKVRYSIPAPFY